MRNLHISPKLKLPPDTVTSTLVVYGGKGMGKTTFGAVLAEELTRARMRFSAIDPMGVMWGLRHSADGKGPGIEALLLGGTHGDIPIEPTGGAVVADLVVDEDVNVIIDISRRPNGKMWGVGERIRFVSDYVTRLYERQGEQMRPLMQIIDEAGRFCPQQIPHGNPDIAKCVGAVERLVEEGRNVGVGVCLITQRSARMNKSVSELADCMVAFRTVGPRSVDAILDWFGEHVAKDRWKALVEQLRELDRGTALVVSPGWLKFEGQVPMRQRETFDSSATPTEGRDRGPRGDGAAPDLEPYLERMAATIDRVKADDPRTLRAEIAKLKAELAKKPAAAPAQVAASAKPVEVFAVLPKDLNSLDSAVTDLRELTEKLLQRVVPELRRVSEPIAHGLGLVANAAVRPRAGLTIDRPVRPPVHVGLSQVARPTSQPVEGDLHIKAGARRMLEVCATFYPGTMTKAQIATAAKMKVTGGTFSTYWGVLTRSGLIAAAGGDDFQVTDAGLAYLGADAPVMPESLDERIAFWKARLKEGARRMLDIVRQHYGFGVTRDELAAQLDMAASGGTFSTYLGTLRRNRLVDEVDGKVVLHTQLVGGA